MPMTHAARQLLRDVAQAIIESGYAVTPRKPYQARQQQIAALADDARLFCHRRSAGNMALLEDVMYACGVDRNGARVLVCKARRVARARRVETA